MTPSQFCPASGRAPTTPEALPAAQVTGGLRWLGTALSVLLLQAGAGADGALKDPAALLRTTGQLRQMAAVATTSSAQRLRLRWGADRTPVDVIFASEAVTAAQAQMVRRITVAVEVPAGRSPGAGQLQALRAVAQTLSAGCLNRPHPALTPHPEVFSDTPAKTKRWLQVTLDLRGATPRCWMPSQR